MLKIALICTYMNGAKHGAPIRTAAAHSSSQYGNKAKVMYLVIAFHFHCLCKGLWFCHLHFSI